MNSLLHLISLIRAKFSNNKRTQEFIDKISADLSALSTDYNRLFNEHQIAVDALGAMTRQKDSWKAMANSLVNPDLTEKELGEKRICYVPMFAEFPFCNSADDAQFKAAQSGWKPEAMVRVVYNVGQFDK